MTAVTPISGLGRRIPIVAKLKSGTTGKGGRPVAIDTWRITTSSREFADDFATKYGGTVERMTNKNSPHDWEVTSEASEVAIALIPDGHYEAYELWSAGGCQRRCDGVTASVLQTTGPDEVEYVDAPCLCDRKGALECSLKSRLTVVLPDLPFRGGVVYETSSQNFAAESKGMLTLIQQLQASGIQRGVLRLEKRKSSGGRRYTLAVVGVSESLEALASGAAGMGSLGRASDTQLASVESPAIEAPRGGEAPPSSPPHPSSSGVGAEGEAASAPGEPTIEQASDTLEDIVDAEIVDEGPEVLGDPQERSSLRGAFFGIVQGLGLDYARDVRPWMEAKYEGHTLSDLPIEKFRALVGKLNNGTQHDKQEARKAFKSAVQEYARSQS